MGVTKVVNVRTDDFDVYIGRGKCPKTGREGIWGNPFKIGDVHGGRVLSRGMCIPLHRDWICMSADGVRLLENIGQLYGKRLGCWCKPERCHGDILVELAEVNPPITSFRGENGFLSNFHGGAFSLENEYQSSKATTEQDRLFVLESPTPVEAKRRGTYLIKCRPDWEVIKMDVMLKLLCKKFEDPLLREKLFGTGYSELIHGNTHGDVFWGKCDGIGENILGQLLMYIRKRLRSGEEPLDAAER